jgi:hypothetical protein
MTARLLRVPALVFSLALAARLPAAPAGQAPAPSGKALPKVLHGHADRQAIVVTHSLLNPAPWPIPGSWTPEGPPIVAALANNPNLFLMLCGHRHGEGRRRVIVGNGPRYIDIVLSDYQSYANGGDGYLRLMESSRSPGRTHLNCAPTTADCRIMRSES